jgi:hypothetical protein
MLRYFRVSLALAMAVMVAVASALAAPPSASAQGRHADYSEFYQALEPFGRWFEHPRWGLVWWPNAQQDEDWRPYSRGQWVYTEEHGWYWEADEEWGWATYHYGRWVLDERYGWLWVPGNEWAPAWVAWRESDEYIGWAPLPPEAVWEPEYGVRYAYAEYERPHWAPIWCFVHPHYLLAPRVWRHFAPRSRHAYLLGRTRHATRYALVHSRIYNRGIDVRHIARITRQDIRTFQVRAFNSPRDSARPHGEHDRDFVGVYRPRFAALSQGARSSPRLTAPDAIENARRSRTSLRGIEPRDSSERERMGSFGPTFKREDPSERSLRSDPPPPFVNAPRNLAPPDEGRRARDRSAEPPPFAKLSPPPPTDESGPRSYRGRGLDRPPSAFVVPPPGDDRSRSPRSRSFDPPQSDDTARRMLRSPGNDAPPSSSLRSRQEFQSHERSRSSGSSDRSLYSRSASPRVFQPQTAAPPSRSVQVAPRPQMQAAPDRSFARDRGNQRGDRERNRNDKNDGRSG